MKEHTILVVDDNRTNLQIIRDVLEKDYPNAVTYREMETYLMTAASVQGGIPAVLRLIQRWRNEYPTRKKMQEMLTRTEKQIRDM